jgi:hypothetical protein
MPACQASVGQCGMRAYFGSTRPGATEVAAQGDDEVQVFTPKRLCRLGNLVLSGRLDWPAPAQHLREFPKSAAGLSQHAVGLAYYARAGQSSAFVVVTQRWLTEPNLHASRLVPACRSMLEGSRLHVG